MNPAEWDFAQCPESQLEFCHDYEFQRCNEAFKNRVRAIRSTLGNWSFAECIERYRNPERFEWSESDKEIEAESDFFDGSPCWYFEEFPEKAFLSIPGDRRALMTKERRWDRSLDVTPFKEIRRLWREFPQDDPDCGALRVPKTTGTVVAFWINWELSPEELTRQFNRWMTENRDKSVPIKERRGKGELSLWRKELKQLATWRLLSKMGWEEAYEVTREHLGKGLWCDRSEVWTRAFKAAERLLARTHG